MTGRGRQGLLRERQAALRSRARAGAAGARRPASRPEDYAALGIPVTYVKAE